MIDSICDHDTSLHIHMPDGSIFPRPILRAMDLLIYSLALSPTSPILSLAAYFLSTDSL